MRGGSDGVRGGSDGVRGGSDGVMGGSDGVRGKIADRYWALESHNHANKKA